MSARLFARAGVPLRPLAAIVRLFWAERGPRLLAGALLAGVTVLAGFALSACPAGFSLPPPSPVFRPERRSPSTSSRRPLPSVSSRSLEPAGAMASGSSPMMRRSACSPASASGCSAAGRRRRRPARWACGPARLLFRLTRTSMPSANSICGCWCRRGAAVLLALVAGVGLGLVAGSGRGSPCAPVSWSSGSAFRSPVPALPIVTAGGGPMPPNLCGRGPSIWWPGRRNLSWRVGCPPSARRWRGRTGLWPRPIWP